MKKEPTLNELRKDLDRELKWYKENVRFLISEKQRLKNKQRRLKNKQKKREVGLELFRLIWGYWPPQRDPIKKEIKRIVREIKVFSNKHGKIISSRGNVTLRLIHGGKVGIEAT